MRLSSIALVGCAGVVAQASNDRPIIAIFAHPSSNTDPGCGGKCDYTAASYPKWIEAAGGRAVPVPYDASDEHVAALFRQTNGLLWPGGGASLSVAAKNFYGRAVAANAAGDHYPIWGTCLGFEWLLQAAANDTSVLQKGFDAENITLPLDFTPDGAQGRVFGSDAALISILQREPVAMNNHMSGMEPATLAALPALSGFFDVLATNADREGRRFVSMIEGKTQPIYGTQWVRLRAFARPRPFFFVCPFVCLRTRCSHEHYRPPHPARAPARSQHPEKNMFEWGEYPDGSPYEVINHSADAVAVAQKLADFFVAEARKNDHKFDTPEAEQAALYYNYSPSKTGPGFVQEYFFHW